MRRLVERARELRLLREERRDLLRRHAGMRGVPGQSYDWCLVGLRQHQCQYQQCARGNFRHRDLQWCDLRRCNRHRNSAGRGWHERVEHRVSYLQLVIK